MKQHRKFELSKKDLEKLILESLESKGYFEGSESDATIKFKYDHNLTEYLVGVTIEIREDD